MVKARARITDPVASADEAEDAAAFDEAWQRNWQATDDARRVGDVAKDAFYGQVTAMRRCKSEGRDPNPEFDSCPCGQHPARVADAASAKDAAYVEWVAAVDRFKAGVTVGQVRDIVAERR